MSTLVVVSIAGCLLQITEATEPPKFISLATIAHFLGLSTKPNILNNEGGLCCCLWWPTQPTTTCTQHSVHHRVHPPLSTPPRIPSTQPTTTCHGGSIGLKCTSSLPAENRDRELWSDWHLILLPDSHWLGEKRKFTAFLTKYTHTSSRDKRIPKKSRNKEKQKEKKERHKDETSTNSHLLLVQNNGWSCFWEI